MAPSRVAGGLTQSSSSSGIFFQGDGQSQAVVNSRLSSPYENSSNSIPGTGRPNLGPVSGDMNSAVLNSVANSGPSVGASSLVTDANSALSGGPHLQRSASINTDSYMRLPASPMSFSSNNISMSGSSVVDGSSVGQQGSHQDPSVQQMQQSQQLQQGASSATSLPTSQTGQVSLPMGARVPGSFMQDPNNLSQVQKKPRLDIKQEDILQQQDNTIAYWRKFVAEYYSPRAKKRWCLSMYDNVGSHALGVFPQAAMDAWQCDICTSKSGRGFEATFEVLPRLNEIKFGSGVIDELLFLDMPRECRFPSGIMMLEYGKAVQESVYEQLRVVREGQLRIIFTQDLKILSWEFCARRHEELFPRRLVAPQCKCHSSSLDNVRKYNRESPEQYSAVDLHLGKEVRPRVNQLLQVAQKCQSTISEGGSEGASQQDLQTNSNMVLTAGRQLVKSLELQSLNDLGFSKRYVRCLQIAEVVNSMKDLIDFCREHKVGPIDGLKNYPRHASAAKLQMQKMQEMEQLATVQGLPTDRNTLNKLMALHPGINNAMANNHHMVGRGNLSGSAQAALALTNYQNMFMRQNSMNSNPNSLHQEASSSLNNSNQSPSSNFQGPAALLPGSMQTMPNHPQSSQGSQALQQQMIQQLLHEMSNNNNNTGVQQPSLSGQNVNGSVARNGVGFASNTTAPAPTTSNVSGSVAGPAPSRSNSFKAAPSNSDSSAAGGNNGFNQRGPDLPQNLHLQDDIVPDIAHEFSDNGFFNNDLDDSMGYGWKA
ncbi:hypothetical protein COLO4_14267 [Corchorus olitorius]|uniref:Transcriptional regulator SLK2 n=1 Tax=Corchorus olitorius TaxID=93759 RepID=A0A1R3JSZ5_9ROSI|nr:hypothetical protein COLO4_14267 [Corchorus olitorius]